MTNHIANGLLPTEADEKICACLDSQTSFSVVAGAGSGKTTSLVSALGYLREKHGKNLRRDGKRVACITFTNRAVGVISDRLGWDDLYLVSTLHSFLWGEIKRFTKEIKQCLIDEFIPAQIGQQQEKDNGGNSQRAIAARSKIVSLTADIVALEDVPQFLYDETSLFSNYSEGKLSHDDVVGIAGLLISNNQILGKIIGQKYPFIFVDEAQDTFDGVVTALNSVCEGEGLPIVGYFGDPMQQIYDKRAGDFYGPAGSELISKEENFRCSPEVIDLLNRYRQDLTQYPAGKNAEKPGSVELILVQAEKPELPRNKYSDQQLDRVAEKFDSFLDSWGWHGQDDVKSLFLVRQMIARRLGFTGLHKLFTGEYASTSAKENYESGEHFLLKPFRKVIWPLVECYQEGDIRSCMNILREHSPAFNPEGVNSSQSLQEMLSLAQDHIKDLSDLWGTLNLGDLLRYVRDNQLCVFSERLLSELSREPMNEEYNRDTHSFEKGCWLADQFFPMDTAEIATYIDFVEDNTPFSTQHGVKGEEYNNIVVLFDDIEAAWYNYSFSKLLTPQTSGGGTEGQLARSRKLTYVCFSRAQLNLKVILYTQDPMSSQAEIIETGLFTEEQVSVQT